jgi:uncharacterized protein (TIGR02300 family)
LGSADLTTLLPAQEHKLLTLALRCGKGRSHMQRVSFARPLFKQFCKGFRPLMIKAEWGTKRTCPKCGTRFYDLTKDAPVECIECGNQWTPEPVLKSKQPLPFEEVEKKKDDADLVDDDLDIDVDAVDGDVSPDNDVDLGGDEDLGVAGTEGDADEQ